MNNNIQKLNYGIIGNCKTSALVKEDSSIEWCCLPQFDSDSIFCKILDKKIGGNFKIECDDSYKIKQEYFKNTCVLKQILAMEKMNLRLLTSCQDSKMESIILHQL